MSTSLVIVAIPEEQDRVWKISSEKVPHCTLLYLGNVDQVQNLDQIVQFVEHAVTLSEHGPFYLDVKRRGELGDLNADVLFFNEKSWNLKWIKQFRGQLMQNQQIRTAYDAAENGQFGAPQEWNPHLTLGYPNKPAKPLGKDGIDDYPIYSVCFDRIAVWTGDFDGPEFELDWPDRADEYDGPLAVAYSDSQKQALTHYALNGFDLSKLEHRGVKGMRWGQSKAELQDPVAHGAAFVDQLVHQSVLVNPTIADQIKAKIRSILDDVTTDPNNEVALFGDPVIRAKIKSVLDDFYKDPNIDDAVVYDALGSAFIEHYGIKGMRWGRRKETPSAITPSAASRVPHGDKRKTKIDVAGGENHPAHEDAIKVAEAKAKLKKSGASALSNQELREVANRVQLENQVAVLTSHKGKLFVRRQFEQEGQNLARAGVRAGAKKGAKKAGRVAATVGTAALL